jgi:hypothetical protein
LQGGVVDLLAALVGTGDSDFPRTDAIVATASSGDLNFHSTSDLERLTATATGDVVLSDDLHASERLELHGGADGAGEIRLAAGAPAEVTLASGDIRLRVGEARFGDDTFAEGSPFEPDPDAADVIQGLDPATLDRLALRGPGGSDRAPTPNVLLRQEASIGDGDVAVGDVLAALPPDADLYDVALNFHSQNGVVVVSADEAQDLETTRLTLSGEQIDVEAPTLYGVQVEGPIAPGSLNVQSSNASVAGDLTTGEFGLLSAAGGSLLLGGDLFVDGDLEAGRGIFLRREGAAQTIEVAGKLVADRIQKQELLGLAELTPILEAQQALLDNADPTDDPEILIEQEDLTLIVAKADGVEMDGDVLSDGGRLSIQSREELLAGERIPFETTGSVTARDDMELADTEIELTGRDAQTLGSTHGEIQIDQDLSKPRSRLVVDGMLRLGESDDGDWRVAAERGQLVLGGGAKWQGDLLAYGRDGVFLSGDFEADTGLPGRFDAVGNPVEDDETEGLVGIRGDTSISAEGISFSDDILQFGEDFNTPIGDLHVDARSGRLELPGDVILSPLSDLTLAASDGGDVHFSAPDDGGDDAGQTLQSGSIFLQPDGGEPRAEANFFRHGDLVFLADNRFEAGTGQKLTATRSVTITAGSSVSVSDVTALDSITINAPEISLVGRGGAPVTLPDGSTAVDDGSELVSNQVNVNGSVSCAGCSVATPTGTEISDSLASTDVGVRAIFPDLRALTTDDLVFVGDSGEVVLDGIARGSAVYDPTRVMAVEPARVTPRTYQDLREFNTAAVGARPLWPDELFEHILAQATSGEADVASAAIDPRLSSEPVARAVEGYRGLFAPVRSYDPESGATEIRSYREQVRGVIALAFDSYRDDAQGAVLDATGFFGHLDRTGRGSEALFYFSALGDILIAAAEAGISSRDLQRFAELLLDDLTPEGLETSDLAHELIQAVGLAS